MGHHETWNKRLSKASKMLADKQRIWFRRGPFHGDYSEQVPKWHVFKDRRRNMIDERMFYLWEAKCGYKKTFDEVIMMEYPQLNLSGKPPKKAEQCVKCRTQIGLL